MVSRNRKDALTLSLRVHLREDSGSKLHLDLKSDEKRDLFAIQKASISAFEGLPNRLLHAFRRACHSAERANNPLLAVRASCLRAWTGRSWCARTRRVSYRLSRSCDVFASAAAAAAAATCCPLSLTLAAPLDLGEAARLTSDSGRGWPESTACLCSTMDRVRTLFAGGSARLYINEASSQRAPRP